MLREKKFGVERFENVNILNSLAPVYFSLGDDKKAIAIMELALKITEKNIGPKHPDIIGKLNDMSVMHLINDNIKKSISLSERALIISEDVRGSDSLDTATCLGTLSIAYRLMGDNAKAVSLLERALAIRDKKLGLKNPDTAVFLRGLGEISYVMDDSAAALVYSKREIDAKQKELKMILYLDEQTRLNWQEKNLSFWFASFMDAATLAKVCLQRKGIILDSLVEDRAVALAGGSKGFGAQSLVKIKSLQSKLSKIAFETGKEMEASKIQDEIGLLQRQLASNALGQESSRFNYNLNVSDVIQCLKNGCVLVDFIQFNDPKIKDEASLCIGALVTTEDNNPIFS
jgi:tetratricopeptide (TPR) repeat protein